MKATRDELRKQFNYVLDNMIQDTLANIDDVLITNNQEEQEVMKALIADLQGFRILKNVIQDFDDYTLNYMFNQVVKTI